MGVYNSIVIPDEGAALLASVIANQGTITFPEVRFSTHDYTGQEQTLTAATFADTFLTAAPSASVHDSTVISVSATISNAGIVSPQPIRTIGVIAEGGDSVPRLVAVSTASSPDIISPPALSPSTYAYNFDITVSSTANITVSSTQAGVLLKGDVINNLTSEDTDKPLSAKQGEILKGLIDAFASPDEVSIKKVSGALVDYSNKLDEYTEQTTAVDLSDFSNGWHFVDDSNASLDYSQLPVTAAEIGANPSWLRIIKDETNESYMAEYTLNDGTGSKWVLPIRYYSSGSPAPTSSDWTKIGSGSGGGSNPNLFFNGWFTVNQRGVTSGTESTAGNILMDMWRAVRCSYSLSTNGFTYTWDGTGSADGLHQRLEKTTSGASEGDTVTMSAIIDGNLYSQTFTIPTNTYEDYPITSDLFFEVVTTNANYNQFSIRCSSTTPHTIKCVKLEEGSESTLHLDHYPTTREQTVELLNCKRYFRVIESGDSIPAYVYSSTIAYASLNFDVPMRAVPQLSYVGTPVMSGSFGSKNVTNLTLSGSSTVQCLRFEATSSGLTTNYSCLLLFANASKAYLSAEL